MTKYLFELVLNIEVEAANPEEAEGLVREHNYPGTEVALTLIGTTSGDAWVRIAPEALPQEGPDAAA